MVARGSSCKNDDAATERGRQMPCVFFPVAENPGGGLSVGERTYDFLGESRQNRGSVKPTGKRRDGPGGPSLMKYVSRIYCGYLWNRFRADPCLNHSI